MRYGVTAQELKSWNDLRRDSLAAGQRLRVTSDVVPVAQKGGKTKHAAATRARASRRPVAGIGTRQAGAASKASPRG